ncbi:unnamed protein product [Peronospora belbahrii]|uniref:Uncharacterized protein n=1 Tax=Peronospora belbahrii TaxID=622444 RepID=A0AAU9L047_9STRA|nr:unnamed protein product [Peronospora belbahrii]
MEPGSELGSSLVSSRRRTAPLVPVELRLVIVPVMRPTHNVCQGDVEAVRSRASRVSSMDEIGYNGDGSVADDVRDALDDALCNDVAANFALFGRFDTQWIVHAQVDDLSFSGTAGGRSYNLNGASLRGPKSALVTRCLGNRFSAQISVFLPAIDMAPQ